MRNLFCAIGPLGRWSRPKLFVLVSLKRIQDGAGVLLGNDSVQRDLDWFFTIRQRETDVVKSVFFEEISTFVNSCFRQGLHFKFQGTRFTLCFLRDVEPRRALHLSAQT
jgi:hypothetical protein